MLRKIALPLIAVATLAGAAPARADVVTELRSQMPFWPRCVAFKLDTYGPNQWLGIDYGLQPAAQATWQMLWWSSVARVPIKPMNFISNNSICPPATLMVAPIDQ